LLVNPFAGAFKLLYDNCEGFRETVDDFTSGVKNSIVGGFGEAVSFIRGIPRDIENILGGLASDALSWGGDMISGFVDGIKNGIGDVENAVKSIASKVANFLHFSVPDEGPLHDMDKSMPDMMDLMSTGIDDNTYKVENSVSNLASKIKANVKIPTLNIGTSISDNSASSSNSNNTNNSTNSDNFKRMVIENVINLDGKELYRGSADSLMEVMQEILDKDAIFG
jgi:phage-related protein